MRNLKSQNHLLLVFLVVVLFGFLSPIGYAYDQAVYDAQQRLVKKGYDPGPVDGLIGKKTAQAIRTFQEENSLPVTGKLDSKTRNALGIRGQPKRNKDLAKVDDLFSVANKPVAVWATRDTDGIWRFKMGPEWHEAVAQVRMKSGAVVEMRGKAQKDDKTGDVKYSLDTKSNKGMKYTVHKLPPTGRKTLAMLSERRYGDRFRLVIEMRADGRKELYLLEELEEPSK